MGEEKEERRKLCMRDPLKYQKLTAPLSYSRKQSKSHAGALFFTYWTMGSSWGQKLMIFHPHRKKKKSFFRINMIAYHLSSCLHRLHNSVRIEWVTSNFQWQLPEGRRSRLPHHKSLHSGLSGLAWQSSQKGLYCEWSLSDSERYPLQKQKYQIKVGFPCPERQRVSLHSESFHFLLPRK